MRSVPMHQEDGFACHGGRLARARSLGNSVVVSRSGALTTPCRLMDAGKVATKEHYERLSRREQRAFLRRLDKLRQKDAILYLTGVTT